MPHPIVIYFSSNSPLEYPFNEVVYKNSYELLAKFAGERGIDLRFVFGAKNYENGLFTTYWTFKRSELVKRNEKFKGEMIYLKTRTTLFDDLKRVNNPSLEKICQDKFLTYTTFPELFKKTVLVGNNMDSIKVLRTDIIVVKPRYGASAQNINILKKSEFELKNFLNDEYIAQEIIESEKGIPGLIAQRHELRLFVFNGIIKEAYLRLPAPNSYLANISAGAKEKLIDLSELPKSTIDVKDKIDAKFQRIRPRLYTIDIMYEEGRPWVVELNDQPGVPDITVQPLTNTYLHSLLDLLTGKL